MPTAAELLSQICEKCRPLYSAFNDPRTSEVIAGDLFVDTCCFVRDEIHFLNNGRLIFTPDKAREGRYCSSYAVVCRKLIVTGGHKPGSLNPCGPDDPGQEYAGNNVITWKGRLQSAGSGLGKAKAADGDSFDRNDWSGADNPSDRHGLPGGTGHAGEKGNVGKDGDLAPGSLTVVALEVVLDGAGHLSLDWDGQTGGRGGDGQPGGDGGNGMGGRDGKTESSWGSESCARATGNGGRGGDGGSGGEGGNGGVGGKAGDVFVISTHGNISGTGGFVSGNITYVLDGGTGGAGGKGGRGGSPGLGGRAGAKGSACDAADDGDSGNEGYPPLANVDDIAGQPGDHGGAGTLKFLDIVSHACSDPIPLPIVFSSAVPIALTRGFSSPDTNDVMIAGANLAQVNSITCSLAGVTATIRPTSTDTQLDVRFSLAGNSQLGGGNLSLARAFGSTLSVPNAVTVARFEVLGVVPATGSKNTTVNVTITGTAFDPSAATHNVNVSGTGVNALNVSVLSSTSLQCTFDISNLAGVGARDVTVIMGGKSHTLLNAFNVTL